MKRIGLLLSAMIISILSLDAQNWQTVRSGRVALFSNDPGYVQSIRIHYKAFSVDSTLISMHIIQQYNSNCFSPYGDSWIGEKVIIQNDGTNLFFNNSKDTIRFKTKAGVNDSWTSFERKDSIKIIAQIKSADTLTILGMKDSVKTIGFQVFDKNGIVPRHYLNDKTLILSKKYGFIKMMNFRVFPEEPATPSFEILMVYHLIGLTNPDLGVQNLTRLRVYDFNPGDELHTLYEWSECCNKGDSTRIKTKLKYPERKGAKDSVVYSVAREQSIYKTIGLKDSISYVYVNDTIRQVYEPDPEFDKLPGEPIITDNTAFDYTMVNEIPLSKRDYSIMNRIIRNDNMCWFRLAGEACFAIPTYLKGLGGPYFSCTNPEGAGGGEKSELVYYKKGSTTWGTPLIITGVKNLEKENQVKVFPNPAADFVTIENRTGKTEKYIISLMDMQGREVFKNETSILNTYKMDLSSLKEGAYLLKLQNGEKLFSKVIIKKP
jgi:hypothetical protein